MTALPAAGVPCGSVRSGIWSGKRSALLPAGSMFSRVSETISIAALVPPSVCNGAAAGMGSRDPSGEALSPLATPGCEVPRSNSENRPSDLESADAGRRIGAAVVASSMGVLFVNGHLAICLAP